MAAAVVAWALYISGTFPSDTVLLQFCNEFLPDRGFTYEEVIGHVESTRGQYVVYVRLVQRQGREIIAPVELVKLDNDKWLIHRSAVESSWFELKEQE